MTEKQRQTIKELKEKIKNVREKYGHRGKEIKKRRDKKRKYSCFICNKSFVHGFVCGKCVEKDLGELNERINRIERELKIK